MNFGSATKHYKTLNALTDDCPRTIGLATGSSTRFLRAAININDLAEIGAAEAVRVVVVIGDTKFAIMVSLGIVPLIPRVGPASVETIVIGPVGVTPILTVQNPGKGGTKRPADDHSGDCRTGSVRRRVPLSCPASRRLARRR